MKKLIMLVMAVSLMVILTACGGGNESATNNGGSSAGDATEVKLVATNFEFDQAEYTVNQGETVNFVLENQEGVHGIEIVGLDVKLDNKTKSQSVTLDEAGEYEIICSIPCGPGHIDMKSKLIVL